MQRRTVLAGTAGFASVTLAGCAGEEEPTEQPTEEPTAEPTEEPTPEPENYVVTDDILTGSEYVPEGTGGFAQSCAPQRTFVPGMQPVFKIGVWDPATGDIVGNDVVDEATVEIDGGPSVELAFSEEDAEWSGSWVIPEDQEPGTVSYTVEVTNEGEFRNVGVFDSEFEVIEFEHPTASYVVTDDTYATSGMGDYENTNLSQACLPNNLFYAGMHVGFAIGVYDGSTGEIVGNDTLDSVTLVFQNGDEVELPWQGDAEEHPAEEWSGAYTIPEDTEPGTFTYDVEVTAADDADAEFHRVGIFQGEITIVEE